MKHIKTPQQLSETSENFNISDVSEDSDRSKLFKTSDFIEWLEKVSPEWINIKDLEMYVSNWYSKR